MPDTTPTDPVPWRALAADEVLRRLETSPEGVRPEEAHRRLALHGPNRLPRPKGDLR